MQNEGLVRAIGVGALGLSVVNLVVGAGIFVLPGRIAAELGAAAILAYLVCSVAVALVFLCFAEVGSRIDLSPSPDVEGCLVATRTDHRCWFAATPRYQQRASDA